MASKTRIDDFQRDKQQNNGAGTGCRDRAIVMGGSMAGLAAAVSCHVTMAR
jgi:hypothetical protein